MIVYWFFILYINNLIIEESEGKSDSFFYSSIIFSLILWFIVLYVCYGKIREKQLSKLLMLSIPYIVFQIFMQILQINVPRMYDILILLLDVLLIYFLYKWNIPAIKRVVVALSYCLFISLTYTIVYKNLWNYLKSEKQFSSGQIDLNFTIKDMNGMEYRITDFKHKTVCIDMWSSSCGNCIASMPDFEKLNLCFTADTNYKIISLYCPMNESQSYKWFVDYIKRKFNYKIDYYYIEYDSFKPLGIRQFPEFFILNGNSELKYRGQIMYEPYVKNNIYDKLKEINESNSYN